MQIEKENSRGKEGRSCRGTHPFRWQKVTENTATGVALSVSILALFLSPNAISHYLTTTEVRRLQVREDEQRISKKSLLTKSVAATQ